MTEAVLSKIAKLLALSNNNTSEAEAALAAEHVQRLLQEHNLTLAQVEQSQTSTDVREKVKTERRAGLLFQRMLMAGLAENNFCYHGEREIVTIRTSGPRKGTPRHSKVHFLVGRKLNINVTLDMYDYLCAAVYRAAHEAGYPPNKHTKEMFYFLEGAVTRVTERLHERRREAERAAKAKVAPAGNGSHKELTITDVYGSEADLNNDALNGYPAGTTAQRRATNARREAERSAKEAELIAAGVPSTEAFYLSHGYGPEEAKTYAENWNRRSRRGGGRGRSSNWTQADDRRHEKVNSAAYQSGRKAGNAVGLDSQVGRSATRALPKKA